MKIACVSDLHGHLPEIPDCDVLLICGDLAMYHKEQYIWLRDEFRPWIHELNKRMQVIGVAGNHDITFEKAPEIVPSMAWRYLQDSGFEFGGLKFWGAPWQRRCGDMSFNLDEPELAKKWDLIPPDTDVLVLHGPPYGYGDFSNYGHVHAGSPTLTQKILEIRPKLVACGHIHYSYGRYDLDGTIIINGALVGKDYLPVNPIQVIEL